MTRSTGNLRLLASALLASAFVLTSCDTTAPDVSASSASALAAAGERPECGPARPASALGAAAGSRLYVDFDDYSDGQRYRESDAESDFGSGLSWTRSNDWTSRGNLLEVHDGALRFRLPPGIHGNGTGGKIRVPIRPRSGYYIQYRVQFETGFDFTPPPKGSNGGKLPGMAGGDGNTGGDPGWDGKGWSARMMWRGDRTSSPNTARLYAYIYYKGQLSCTGEYVDTGFDVTAGKQYVVRIYVGMNTKANNDGRLKVWLKENDDPAGFGNSKASRGDILWMDNNHTIDEALIQVFNGGGTSKWDLSTTSFIRIDDIATCHTSAECDGLL
ncbi:hypothetical protein RQM47_07805 [Rubrivirga sp. S365]|uniref:polysaccharide lyase n=1 Tax=Rubrivirga sp. S365 TaxID=3076080 RepID=UPI0028C53C5C|nr:hypothetical protein [Rubrivirga sp. S365]MDT7856540.1 hypothetical protein [Rubrivirga sp. S365]